MQIFPIGFLVLAVWCVIVWRNADRAVAFSLVLVPFGMLAVMRLPIGGMTPLASHVIAVLSICLLVIGLPFRRAGGVPYVPIAAIPLLLFAVYACFASTVLVRFFTDEFLVFPPGRYTSGVLVSNNFAARLSPLRPTPSNISQTAYLLLSVGFFLAVADVVQRRGAAYLVSALRIAAVVNICLGLINLVQLDFLLAPFRTADYNLLDTHTVAGVTRLVGGFAEASAFGPVSAVFAAFFLVLGYIGDRPRDVVIGAVNAGWAILSLSTTGYLCLGVLALFFVLRGLRTFVLAIDHRGAFALLASTALAGAVVLLSISSGILGELPGAVIDNLFFNKAQSNSGLERSAMARQGLVTFAESGGVGVGVGTVRANGFISALLAATGLPGLFLVLWFIKASFFDGTVHPHGYNFALRRASQAAALVSFAAAAVSSFSVDPGFIVVLLAVLSVSARSQDSSPVAVPA